MTGSRLQRRLRETAARFAHAESGQSLVLTVLALTVLLGCGALAVDLGASYVVQERLQNAADEAALAGIRSLAEHPGDAARCTAEALRYAESNGAQSGETRVTLPYDGSPYKLEVVISREMKYSFTAGWRKEKGTVSARAVAECQVLCGPFDYAIFSGNQNYELPFNVGSMVVGGSIHSNDNMALRSTGITVNGDTEAVNTIYINGGITINGGSYARQIIRDGLVIAEGEQGRFVDMPDFSDIVKAAALRAGTCSTGFKQFSGDAMFLSDPIYVDGDVQFNTPMVISGSGIIIATGNIMFNAASVLAPGASVCFYSKNGNIQINAGEIQVDGILYAPNGMIQANTASFVVNGRVVADKLQFNAASVQINQGVHDKDCLPRLECRLIE